MCKQQQQTEKELWAAATTKESKIKLALATIKRDSNTVFFADEKTKVCVAMRTTDKRDGSPKLTVGVARCNENEKFIKPIGMAIALFRARGKKVPENLMKF